MRPTEEHRVDRRSVLGGHGQVGPGPLRGDQPADHGRSGVGPAGRRDDDRVHRQRLGRPQPDLQQGPQPTARVLGDEDRVGPRDLPRRAEDDQHGAATTEAQHPDREIDRALPLDVGQLLEREDETGNGHAAPPPRMVPTYGSPHRP